jgi:hypothetical protein
MNDFFIGIKIKKEKQQIGSKVSKPIVNHLYEDWIEKEHKIEFFSILFFHIDFKTIIAYHRVDAV